MSHSSAVTKITYHQISLIILAKYDFVGDHIFIDSDLSLPLSHLFFAIL